MDGTLIDSMPLHHRSWQLWPAEQGLAFDEDGFFEAPPVAPTWRSSPTCSPPEHEQSWTRWPAQGELYREIAATELQLIAGAEAICLAARRTRAEAGGVHRGTAGQHRVAFERFGTERLGGHAVTSPADGLRGKPHPDIFLAAARAPGRITRSLPGVRGRAAGHRGRAPCRHAPPLR
jgi:beta-phosphoglucomutase